MDNLPGQLFLTDIFGSECFKSIKNKLKKTDFDYLLDVVIHGTGFQNGKERVFEIIRSNKTKAEQTKLIKSEYGIGGSYWRCNCIGMPETAIGYQTFGSKKGFIVNIQDSDCEEKKLEFTWTEVRDAICKQIEARKYIVEKKMAA